MKKEKSNTRHSFVVANKYRRRYEELIGMIWSSLRNKTDLPYNVVYELAHIITEKEYAIHSKVHKKVVKISKYFKKQRGFYFEKLKLTESDFKKIEERTKKKVSDSQQQFYLHQESFNDHISSLVHTAYIIKFSSKIKKDKSKEFLHALLADICQMPFPESYTNNMKRHIVGYIAAEWGYLHSRESYPPGYRNYARYLEDAVSYHDTYLY